MPEWCCLTKLPTADWDTGEIQRTVSQSELIEPLGITLLGLILNMAFVVYKPDIAVRVPKVGFVTI